MLLDKVHQPRHHCLGKSGETLLINDQRSSINRPHAAPPFLPRFCGLSFLPRMTSSFSIYKCFVSKWSAECFGRLECLVLMLWQTYIMPIPSHIPCCVSWGKGTPHLIPVCMPPIVVSSHGMTINQTVLRMGTPSRRCHILPPAWPIHLTFDMGHFSGGAGQLVAHLPDHTFKACIL